ncbi:hypothetical protein J5N97_013016 [Dioscorea zingiberensis]|uniref:Uncharacterized protein n=1 Tax=Dioscorea zingiberensis TaxID=325984 RepID=A0A9D5CRD5_9LILI|nr:hypothetical protein J5N97_013016 [Dioscorea zingiberensis]
MTAVSLAASPPHCRSLLSIPSSPSASPSSLSRPRALPGFPSLRLVHRASASLTASSAPTTNTEEAPAPEAPVSYKGVEESGFIIGSGPAGYTAAIYAASCKP